ncbi:Protein of unknown function DUF2346 family-containing protein [Strongyloides ratti]|uniref:Uncharacterized protein n=1 Tax=Strongyloides ratti TaxID=34506 RepID=A0A090KYZ8_STRRB|nr:Protein of unknown function DUF2346 family-containing protein [Strongyloides ratti]CEF62710.1 Protein of unknown function DUF2346 family-containing protein [Strongyloides ratti]
MGGWRLETVRYCILVVFPVVSFWAFNQPSFFKFFMKDYKISDTSKGDAAISDFTQALAEKKRKAEYEKFLRQEMEFEKDRRIREASGLTPFTLEKN